MRTPCPRNCPGTVCPLPCVQLEEEGVTVLSSTDRMIAAVPLQTHTTPFALPIRLTPYHPSELQVRGCAACG